MMIVKERRACSVDFYYEVDHVDHADDAIDAVHSGAAKYVGCSIQDSLEFCDSMIVEVDSIPCGIERG